MKKRIVAMLLCVLTLFCMMSVTAFAEDAEVDELQKAKENAIIAINLAAGSEEGRSADMKAYVEKAIEDVMDAETVEQVRELENDALINIAAQHKLDDRQDIENSLSFKLSNFMSNLFGNLKFIRLNIVIDFISFAMNAILTALGF